MSLEITPETRVATLLAVYPELEEVLIRLSPAFQKLRNPVVRSTVAKVATLEQAARIGGVAVGEMLRRIREAAGQEPSTRPADLPVQAPARGNRGLLDYRVIEEIDADLMLEGGVHPIGRIREAVASLGAGESVRLRSSFRPQPLIDIMLRGGADVYSVSWGSGFLTYFGRKVE